METIKGIINEACRELDLYNDNHDWKQYLGKLLPRIEAAHFAEISHLCAALKPVLEVDPNSAVNGYDWSMINISAVCESKRIFNERKTNNGND